MKKITIIVVLCLQTLVGLGQINFKALDGYIITLNHDTIYGEVLKYPTTSLSTMIKFKANKSDNFIEYTPNNLLGFYIGPDKEFTVISAKEKVKKKK